MSTPQSAGLIRMPRLRWFAVATLLVMGVLVVLAVRPILQAQALLERINHSDRGLVGNVKLEVRHPEWMDWCWSWYSSEPLYVPQLDEIREIEIRETLDEVWLTELRKCHSLEVLQIQTRLDEPQAESLRSLTELHTLSFYYTDIDDGAMRHVGALPSLRQLTIWHAPLSDRGLELLGSPPALERLCLCRTRVTAAGFEMFLPQRLRHLAVFDSELSEDAIAALGRLSELTHLELDADLTAAGGRTLARLSKLESLKLFGTIRAGALDSMPHLTRVYWLDLQSIEWDANIDLSPLARCAKLQTLRMTGGAISDEKLIPVASAPRLESLSLQGTSVNGTVFQSSGWKEIQTLDLRQSNISGEGLIYLSSLSNLKLLDLRGTGIDAADLPRIEQLTSLTTLVIDFNESEVAGLRRSRPALRIISAGLHDWVDEIEDRFWN